MTYLLKKRMLWRNARAAEVAGATAGVNAVGVVAEGWLVLSLDGTVVAAVSILIAELLTLSSGAARIERKKISAGHGQHQYGAWGMGSISAGPPAL